MPPKVANTTGLNYAPAEPLAQAREIMKGSRTNGSSLCSLFREIFEEIEQVDEVAWQQSIEMGQVVSNMRDGKLVMKQDLTGTGYVFLPRLPEDQDRSNYPIFPQNSEILKSKWQKARPQVRARCFGDGYKTKLQMSELELCVNSYFKDIFTKHYELEEALSAQDFGTYITRFWYDDRLNRMQMLAPILQQQSRVVMEGYGACLSCAYEGKPEDFAFKGEMAPRCPDCGSYQTTRMVEPKKVDEFHVTDVEVLSQGDITGALLPFPSCKYDLRKFAHDSSYFKYDQWIPIRLIKNMFGAATMIAPDVDSDHIGLRVMEALATRGGNIENLGDTSFYGNPQSLNERARYTELWLKPEWYAGFRLDQSEKTLAGTIPANVPFEKIFPEGVCLQGFNRMRLITGLHAEEANLVSGVYMLQSFSGIGKGLSDGVDVAKDINELHSMAMAGLKRFGASGVFYDKSTLSLQNVKKLFQPNQAVPIDLAKNPHISRIDQAVGQIQNNPVNAVLPQYAIQLTNLLNMALMTGDFTQGMTQDVDINTLGGQQLAHAKMEEQKGAILTMKVFHRERSAEIITKLCRSFLQFEKYFSHDERHGTTKGKWISGANLPERVKFDGVPDSEIPTNTFEKQNAAKEMVEKTGGLANLAMIANSDPRLTGWYADQFGAKLPNLDEEEVQLVCIARLDDIKELSGIYANPEEILGQLKKPLNVREYGHLLKAQFLAEILDDDEVSEWNPLAKMTVNALIEAHYTLADEAGYRDASRQQQYQFRLQNEAMQTQYAMQKPMNDQQQADRQAEADRQNEQAAIHEVGGRILDDEQKQVEHDRQGRRDEEEHRRAIELEQLKQQNSGGKATAK